MATNLTAVNLAREWSNRARVNKRDISDVKNKLFKINKFRVELLSFGVSVVNVYI